ncbi:MAG: adenosylcobinamide amidohydrolase [Pseudomonadota bacterium]
MTKKIYSLQSSIEHTNNHIHVELHSPCIIISSAVLNGGIKQAKHIVNLKVSGNPIVTETPEQTVNHYCTENNWHGTTIGMMTAASMDSFRLAIESEQGIQLCVLVTSGLSNPRRAGDRADQQIMVVENEQIGTINTIILSSATLTGAALVEALMIATEAKSTALYDAGIISPVSNLPATGTGTDAIAIVSGKGPETVRYCGKHVLFGEILGRLVYRVVMSSIKQLDSHQYNR